MISFISETHRVVSSYTTMPSFQMTPSRNLQPTSTERHGIGRHLGSSFQGSVSTTFFAKNSMSLRLRAMGPFTELTASCPANPLFASAVGNLPKDGLKVKIPVQAAGIRREPPRDQSQSSIQLSDTLHVPKRLLISAVQMHSVFTNRASGHRDTSNVLLSVDIALFWKTLCISIGSMQ